MQLSKKMLHPYSKHRSYVPCKFELCVHLQTYDAMRTQRQFITLRKMTLTHGIMHDTMTSITSTWRMEKRKEITYNVTRK